MTSIAPQHFFRPTLFLAFAFFATTFSGDAQEHNAAPKTAAQQFKNIQVLKDIPADQLIPTMQFIGGALDVDCEFCHVRDAMEKDDKKEKQTARKMMAMELTINADQFDGRIEVTCYTCHRGSPHAVGIPVLSAATANNPPLEHHEDEEHANLPTAGQILDKYLAAVGGADALYKVKTRIQRGTIDAAGEQYPIEIYSVAPENRVSITHPSYGDSVTAFNGEAGWMATPSHMRAMNVQETAAARIDAQVYLPARIRELYQKFEVHPGETISGHATYMVVAEGAAMPPLQLYFDQQTGLLLRLVRYAQTPLGRNPTEIDYADYRDAGGVKIPYQWMLTRTNGNFTIHISSIQQNVPVDEKLFVMPPPSLPLHP
jgi:photosynthetic reaction center cytochrome c subunit